jgi:hypothetical protein
VEARRILNLTEATSHAAANWCLKRSSNLPDGREISEAPIPSCFLSMVRKVFVSRMHWQGTGMALRVGMIGTYLRKVALIS